MDVTDYASEREDAHRAAAIAAVLDRLPSSHGAMPENCENCGDFIPEARRLILPGVLLCVYCQGLHERGMRP